MSTYAEKIAALLAKAQGTDNEEEAQAFMAGAQRLMAKYSITEAMLPGSKERTQAEYRTIVVGAPYASAKGTLLAGIAEANGCFSVRMGPATAVQTYQVFGFPVDLDNFEQLFLSLELQATRHLLLACKTQGMGGSSAFKHAFLLGFAGRVWGRLMAAREVALADYESDTGTSTALVLADRSKDIDNLIAALIGKVRKLKTSASDARGFDAGDRAGDQADLGQGRMEGTKGELCR